MPHPISDLRAFLLGSWRTSRRIRDFRLGACGRFEGQTIFQPAADGLVQEESGDLHFGAYRGGATRRYRIAIDPSGTAMVHHADGSPFHALDLSSGTADIAHQCADDMYRGRYRVLHDNCFWVTWHVTGPRKQYRLVTRHVRSAPNA